LRSALIFIGPKELPAVLHKMGQATAAAPADEFRRYFEDLMREVATKTCTRTSMTGAR
jgi:hypothetical protein